MILALKELHISRAFGKDVYASKETSQLVTTGIYAYTRNPVYLAATLLFLGWFFTTRFTVLVIMTVLFLVLFIFVAKWEEQELTDRFGDTYHHYKETVPFFIPYPKRHKSIPNGKK
jgi:protein-S-isoprenylcysteine O-methyltransferase Ste14